VRLFFVNSRVKAIGLAIELSQGHHRQLTPPQGVLMAFVNVPGMHGWGTLIYRYKAPLDRLRTTTGGLGAPFFVIVLGRNWLRVLGRPEAHQCLGIGRCTEING